MTWQSASRLPSESRWTTSGSSLKADVPVRNVSKTGSASSETARLEPVGVGAAVAAGAGHDAHLAGADGEPAGVEVLPQRQGDHAVRVPGHLDDVALVAHQLQGALQACLRGGAVDHDVAVRQGVVGVAEVDAEGVGERALGGVDVDQLQPAQREGSEELGDHAADQPGADHGDAVAEAGSGLPEGVDRGFHGAGEHGAAGGNVVRDLGERLDRDDVAVLVRVQAEDRLALPVRRAVLDDADGEVAELHR